MALPLVEPITRSTPVDWLGIVRDALEGVEVTPLAPSLVNTLTTLNSYSAAPPSLYANAVSGLRDVQVHVALLRALDKSVSAWPAALRRHIYATPPVRGPARRARTSGRGSDILMEGIRPLAEAVLVLYNAAAANLEAGLTDLERVHTDAACLGPATRDTSRSGSSSEDNAFKAAAALRAPSVNAKAAYKHFLVAQQLAAAALALLGPTTYGIALSPTETQYLRGITDLQGVSEVAGICTATAKYIFSLFSSATARKPDTLARLAFTASAMPMPSLTASTSAHLLPSILLAAYHQHRAEYYYEIEPQVPDIANALGHIRVAESILRELDRQYSTRLLQEDGQTTPSAKRKRTEEKPSAWGARLWSRLRELSSSPTHPKRSRTEDAAEEEGVEEQGSADADASPVGNGSFCVHLTGTTQESDDMLSRMFPVLGHLLRRVRELAKRYEKENNVVYYAKPTPTIAVQADVPDVDLEAEYEANCGPAVMEATTLPPPPSVIDDSVFDALPSVTDLTIRVTVHQQKARQQQDLLDAVERLSETVTALQSFGFPEEVELALEAFQPCLEPHTGSVRNAMLVAKDALQASWHRHLEAAAQWIEAQGQVLAGRRGRIDGVQVEPSPLTLSLKADVECWEEAEADARQQWLAAIGPFDVASTRSVEAIRRALLPDLDAIRAFTDRCAATVDRVVSVDGSARGVQDSLLHRGPTEGEQLAMMNALQEEGQQLLRRVRPLYEAADWEGRQAAMRAVAVAIWDAPQIVNRVDEGTTRLTDETAEALAVAKMKMKLDAGKATRKAKRPATAASDKKPRASAPREERDEEVKRDSTSTGFRTPIDASDDDAEDDAAGSNEEDSDEDSEDEGKDVKQGKGRIAAIKRKAKKAERSDATRKHKDKLYRSK